MSAIATLKTSSLSIGDHQITADYGGDGVFLGSTSSHLSEVVTSETSVATLATSSLGAGTHQITATYGGDDTHAVSTSSALSERINQQGSLLPWTATVLPSGKSVVVQVTRQDGDGYNLAPLAYRANGVDAPLPALKINGGSAISLADVLWAPNANYDQGNPFFFLPIPQPAPDVTFVDDRNSLLFDGVSSYARSGTTIPGTATFSVCFKASSPSGVIASQGAEGTVWEIRLGGTASALTVTFNSGGHSLTVSQLTKFMGAYDEAKDLDGGWSVNQPRYTLTAMYGPTNLVVGKWYRAVIAVDSSGANFRVANDGYATTDLNGNFGNSVAYGEAVDSSLTLFPQSTTLVYLGRSAIGGAFFSGRICDVQINGGALQLRPLANLTLGGHTDYSAPTVLARWSGPSGTALVDTSGNSAPAFTITNATWDADVMVSGMHSVEGTTLGSSHGLLALSGTWTPVRWQSGDYSGACPGFNGGYWQTTDPGAVAEYRNTSLTPGRPYRIWACYVGDFDRTTQAQYFIHDGGPGGTQLGGKTLDQTTPCEGLSWDGVSWTSLGTFTPSGTTLTVILTRGQPGKMIADALRFEGVVTPVKVGPSDTATLTMPDSWADLNPTPYPQQASSASTVGGTQTLVNRSGDVLNQKVKSGGPARTMKVGYNPGPVANGGPNYWYRNRIKDQNYNAPSNSVSRHHPIFSDLRGQLDVTSTGLWTVSYRTLDGTGNHVTLSVSDDGPNVLGSTIVDHGETSNGDIRTRTYTITCSPSKASPNVNVSWSGDIDYPSVGVYPPDPSNPSRSLTPLGPNGEVWHPNFLANMSVGLDSLRFLGTCGFYNAAVLSDYGLSTDQKVHPFEDRNRSGALITSIGPVDVNMTTDADGIVGYGYRVNLCFYKVTTATPHNMYPGDCVGLNGTNMPWSIPASYPGNPNLGSYVDVKNTHWDSSLSFASALVVKTPSPTVFIMEANVSIWPSNPPADGAPGTIGQTITPSQYGDSDWYVQSNVGYNLPLDHVCDLCNRTGAIPHWNLGHMVTSQGAYDIGRYFAQHLNSDIGIRVEYANEPFSFYPTFRYLLMQAQYGAWASDTGHADPLGLNGNSNSLYAYAALATRTYNDFVSGWTSTGRSASQVRKFYNNVVNGMGWMASSAKDFGATDIDVGYSPYYFNDYYLSGSYTYYINDPSVIVDKMDVEQWLDHFEVMMQGSWEYWGGQQVSGSLVAAGFGHWVDENGNPYGDSSTKYKPGLKYVPGGPSGTAHVVTYEGGLQQPAISFGSYSSYAGSYMMPTKCRQLFRHPRMKSVNDSCLQNLNDVGHSVFVRFQVGGFINQGMIRYWSDLDLYNQTFGKGDGSDGKNNNILYPESSTAISPAYTSIHDWALGIR